MSAVVVNIRTVGSAFDVYIGRASGRGRDPRCRKGSPFGNPFKRNDGESVEAVLEQYEWHMRAKLDASPGLVTRLLALDGKRLACWCKPEPCHGDVLLRLIDEAKRGVRRFSKRG